MPLRREAVRSKVCALPVTARRIVRVGLPLLRSLLTLTPILPSTSGTTSYSLADRSSSKKPKSVLLASDLLLDPVLLVRPAQVQVAEVASVLMAVLLVRWARAHRCVPSVLRPLIPVRSVRVAVATTRSPIARVRRRRRRGDPLLRSVSVASGAGMATTTTSRLSLTIGSVG